MASLRVWRLCSSSSTPYHLLHSHGLPSHCFPPLLSSRKSKCPVPVFAGKNHRWHRIFLVDPHILEHWFFQELLRKSQVRSQWFLEQECDEVLEWIRCSGSRGIHQPICLDCDAILFEFFVWLVQNDDPSLRDLNLNDLMEFYGAES